MRFPFALGPIVRVSLGLVALFTSLVMIADLVLGLLPQRAEVELQVRRRIAENVAAQTAVVLGSSDTQLLGKSLQQVMSRNRDLLSVALRQGGSGVVAQRGDHNRYWVIQESERSRWNHVQVPLFAEGKQWGQLEMAFVHAEPRDLIDRMREPVVQFYFLVFIGGFLLCYVYLRRVMLYLDPSTAVPERVRSAFDTLSDGVLVLDPQGRIMLANRAFRELHPDGDGELQGRAVADLQWLPRHVAGDSTELPWDRVLRGVAAAPDERMTIAQPDGKAVETVVRCSPVNDIAGRVRGCIVTFHDVTDVYAVNDQLRQTLGDLERTREQINTQNEELRRLAMRDPMTGCFNRRAFFDAAGGLVATAAKGDSNLCCIMSDIDHFKGFNDLYGHTVGDQVIQVVARALAGSIRNTDMLCRYGGEEFCILLPNTGIADACMIAERARSTIENGASTAIRSVQVRKITSSFGVSSLTDGALGIQELIDQADQALYASKEAGRNRVTVWTRNHSA
jgi:diguanylate cyclase (GGDEF)-like protein/PAS domain S-box-containing protein